jgi:hypothetical protein
MYFVVSFFVKACQVLPDFTTKVTMWFVPRPHIWDGPLPAVRAVF